MFVLFVNYFLIKRAMISNNHFNTTEVQETLKTLLIYINFKIVKGK